MARPSSGTIVFASYCDCQCNVIFDCKSAHASRVLKFPANLHCPYALDLRIFCSRKDEAELDDARGVVPSPSWSPVRMCLSGDAFCIRNRRLFSSPKVANLRLSTLQHPRIVATEFHKRTLKKTQAEANELPSFQSMV